MKTQHLLAMTLGALIAIPVASRADNVTGTMAATSAPSGSGLSALSSTDKDFIDKATQGGKTEVKTSKLAKKISSSDAVKAFADQMIDDHGKANAKLMKIAKGLNVTLATELDTKHQGEVDELKGATGADFDQKFIEIQDKEHNDAVNAFQKEADKGDNAQLKAFAAKTLPTLQMHMEKVKALEAQVPPAAAMSGPK